MGAALDVDDGRIREARIALGGVAHKPWLARNAATALAGKATRDLDFDAIAHTALEGAQPLSGNAYKVPLAANAIARALRNALEAA